MATQRDVLEQGLTRDELIALRNQRTGITVFQVSWIMVFVCLILINLQIRSNFPTWPPEGVAQLDRVLPTGVTVLLILSAFTGHRAVTAMRANDYAAFRQQWMITLGLGVVFVAAMAFEWLTVQFSGQYSTIFRVMTAYHAIHALVIGYYMLRVQRKLERLPEAKRTTFDPVRHFPAEAGARLWDFVVIAWGMFYVVLYVI